MVLNANAVQTARHIDINVGGSDPQGLGFCNLSVEDFQSIFVAKHDSIVTPSDGQLRGMAGKFVLIVVASSQLASETQT